MKRAGDRARQAIALAALLLLIAPETPIRIHQTTPSELSDRAISAAAESASRPAAPVPAAAPAKPAANPHARPKSIPKTSPAPIAGGAEPPKRLPSRTDQTLILKLRPGAKTDPHGALASYQTKPEVQTRMLGNLDMLLLTFPASWDTAAVTAALSRDDSVQYIGKDAVMKAQTAAQQPPDDPQFEAMSGYSTPQFRYLETIKAADAWHYTTGSTEIVVAILDTGIDDTHPDLKNNLWVNQAELNGRPGIDDDHPDGPIECGFRDRNGAILLHDDRNTRNRYCDDIHGWSGISENGNIWDDELGGHGTAVAGIIGAQGNNGIHSVGVAWQTSLMPVKVLGASGFGYFSDFIFGLEYILEMKRRGTDIRVVNASLGFVESLSAPSVEILKQCLSRLKEQGILFVSAAGNDGENIRNTLTDATIRSDLPGSLSSVLDNILNIGGVRHSNIGRIFLPSIDTVTIDPGSNYSRTHVSLGASYYAPTLKSNLTFTFPGVGRVGQPLWTMEPAGSWMVANDIVSLEQVSTTSHLTSPRRDLSGLDPSDVVAVYARVRYTLPDLERSAGSCGTALYCMFLSAKTDNHDDWIFEGVWFRTSRDEGDSWETVLFRARDEFKAPGFQYRFEPLPFIGISTTDTVNFEIEESAVLIIPTVPASVSPIQNAVVLSAGTSFAAPQVSGAAALLWAHRPDLSYREVSAAIRNTVTPLTNSDDCTGGQCFKHNGTLNLSKALAYVTTPGIIINTKQVLEPVPGATTGRAEFTIRLSREPGIFGNPDQVQITLGNDVLTPEPQTLSFDATNWYIPQTVQVTYELPDPLPSEYPPLTMQVVGNSDTTNAYTGVTAEVSLGKPHLIEFTDKSLPEGTQRRFTLSLSKAPVETVTLTPVTEPPGQLSFTPPQITFTRDHWSMRTFTMSAPAVNLRSAEDTTVLVSFVENPADSLAASDTATITITDNGQTLGITLEQTQGRLREGTTLTLIANEKALPLAVSLQGRPASTVVLIFTVQTDMIEITPSNLTFTPDNWNRPQIVSVSAMIDPASLTQRTLSQANALSLSVDTAVSDAQFADVPQKDIAITFYQPPRLIVSPADLRLEENSSLTLNVQLNHSPQDFGLSEISVFVVAPNPKIISAHPPLTTFTTVAGEALYYSKDHPVRLAAAWDERAGDYIAPITLVVPGTSVFAAATTILYIHVTNTELAISGLHDITLDEGDDAVFNLSLPATPAATVTLTPVSNPIGQLNFNPPTLVFSSDDWTTKRLTVSAPIDPGRNIASTTILFLDVQGNSVIAPTAANIMIDRSPRLVGLNDRQLQEGGQYSFTLDLSKAPLETVTLTPVADPSGRLSFMPPQLVFTPSDWTGRTLTVSASIDLLAIEDFPVSLSLAENPTDSLITTAAATITITDNHQAPGILLQQAQGRLLAGSTTMPRIGLIVGEALPLSVNLQGQPASSVVLELTARKPSVEIMPANLTFTPDNWHLQQKVTVTAVIEPASLTERTRFESEVLSLSVNAAASDAQFADVPQKDFTVIFFQPPRLIVTPIALRLDENSSLTLHARLNHSPQEFNISEIAVDITSMPSVVSAAPTQTIFTPDLPSDGHTDETLYYNRDHPIILTAERDGQAKDYTSTVTLTIRDTVFAAATTSLRIHIINTELAISGLHDITLDEGDDAVFNLSLPATPAATVTLTPVSNPIGQLNFNPPTLVFSSDDWTTKRLTVSAPIDPGRNIVSTAILFLDVQGNSVIAPTAANIMIDRSPRLVGLTDRQLQEGRQYSFTLDLSKAPLETVTLTPVADPSGRLSFMPPQLVFTPSDWTGRTLTVSASIDLLTIEDLPVSLSLAENPTDSLITTAAATITITDNHQAPGILLQQAQGRLLAGSTTMPSIRLIVGEALPLSVNLQGQPASNVVLELTARKPSVEIMPANLTFTPDNWHLQQKVTVTAVIEPASLTERTRFESEVLSLSVNAAASDAQFADVPQKDIAITFYQSPRLIVSPADLRLEENSSLTLHARLNHSPQEFNISEIAVDITSMPSVVSAAPTQTIFTPDLPSDGHTDETLYYNRDHPIILTAERDGQAKDYTSTVTLTIRNTVFAAATTSLRIHIINTELAISGLHDATLNEGGSIAFTLSLSAAPDTPQRIVLTPEPAPDGQLEFNPPTLVFTRDDWSPKRLTLSAPLDRHETNTEILLHFNVQGDGVIPPVPAKILIDRDNPVIRMKIKVLLEGALQ